MPEGGTRTCSASRRGTSSQPIDSATPIQATLILITQHRHDSSAQLAEPRRRLPQAAEANHRHLPPAINTQSLALYHERSAAICLRLVCPSSTLVLIPVLIRASNSCNSRFIRSNNARPSGSILHSIAQALHAHRDHSVRLLEAFTLKIAEIRDLESTVTSPQRSLNFKEFYNIFNY